MSDYNAMSLDELMTFAKELERDNRHVQASRARIAANNRRAARDDILDLAEQLDAEGLVVVPKRVTPEMIASAWRVMRRHGMPRIGSGPAFTEAYDAMIAAAPSTASTSSSRSGRGRWQRIHNSTP